MAAINITSVEAAGGLLEPGFGLGADQFTFSIPTTGSVWPRYNGVIDNNEPFSASYGVINAGQAAAFRAALASWDDLIAPDFTELADNAATRGEIRIAFSDVGADTAAYAYAGNPQLPGGLVGDIWLSDDYATLSFARGSYQYETLIHEVGHALGLKHSFEEPALTADFENTRYTVMSYTNAVNSELVTFARSGTSLTASFDYVAAVTPMVLDIAAAQRRYGADTGTRTGDTVYTFIQGEAVLQSIYDAGGTDTIDLAGFTRSNVIDLTPASYSSIGQYGLEEQIADWTARFPSAASFIREVLTDAELFTFADNLGIAFGTVIENARGGSAADRITGNDVANILDGGGGNDVLTGGPGDDRLIGGGGDDVITGGEGNDVYVFSTTGSGADRITDYSLGVIQAVREWFDLGGGAFTAVAPSGVNGTLLSHAGGTVQIDSFAGLTLAEWNQRVIGAPSPGTAPTIVSAASVSVAENVAPGTIVYTVTATDPEGGPLRFALSGAAVFTIDAATGAVRLQESPDFERLQSSLAITVTATDAGGLVSAPRTVTITITNVNEAPVFATATRAVSVAENSTVSIPVLTGGATDPDTGAVLAYSLSGTDAAAFAVNASTGAVTFRASPDFETRSAYSFTLVATDFAGLSASQAVSVVVTDVNESGPPPSTSQQPNFFLLVPAGAAATVQGSGTVFGSVGGTQQVTVLDTPGRITFDGSFNTGGDRIVLSGPASAYTVMRSGATVEISDGDTRVAVPAGTVGADIVFADGVRSLTVDAAASAVRLGGQLLTAGAVAITAAAGPATAIGTTSAGVASQLLVIAGGVATASGLAGVFGTIAGQETVTVASGARLAFDGSFNAGGDRIVLAGAASSWTAARSGGTVSLVGSNGESITVPVGRVGLTLDFADGGRTLVFDAAAGVIRIGDMALGTAAAAITGAATVDADISRLAFARDAPVPTDVFALPDPILPVDAGLMPTVG